MSRRLMVLIAILPAVTALADERIVETSRPASGYDGVHVGSGIQARVEDGPAGPVLLRGEASVLPRVLVTVENGTLIIHIDHQGPPVTVHTPIEARVRLPQAARLGASGGAKVTATVPAAPELGLSASGGATLIVDTPLRPRQLSLEASGGARISATAVQASGAEVALSGAARVILGGRIGAVTMEMSGAGALDGRKLDVDTLEIAGSGGSKAAVRTRTASGALSGGSRLHVLGGGERVAVATSGGAEVVRDL